MTKQVLIIFMLFTGFFAIITYITLIYIACFVKKDIEKRLNNKIEFPVYSTMPPWGFLGKYSSLSASIYIIYLIEKRIIKKRTFLKNNFLTRINYSSQNEKKINIIVCFIHSISLLLFCIFVGLTLYIGSQVYKT